VKTPVFFYFETKISGSALFFRHSARQHRPNLTEKEEGREGKNLRLCAENGCKVLPHRKKSSTSYGNPPQRLIYNILTISSKRRDAFGSFYGKIRYLYIYKGSAEPHPFT